MHFLQDRRGCRLCRICSGGSGRRFTAHTPPKPDVATFVRRYHLSVHQPNWKRILSRDGIAANGPEFRDHVLSCEVRFR